MSHLPPAIVAQGDQIMARADETLQVWIDRFRDHVAEHDGETLCPFADSTSLTGRVATTSSSS